LSQIWLATADSSLSAAITLGTNKTTQELFTTIKNAFLECNDTHAVGQRGAIYKIVISFPMNLGPRFRRPRVLTAYDDNKPLLALRRDVLNAFEEYREDMDGEEIICFSTVFFKDDELLEDCT
jgi:hypothetical protein